MTDREKVIKALTECIFLHEHPDDDAGCLECPYRPDEKGTCPTMIPFLKDVLELLKEQELTVKFSENCMNYVCSNCGVYINDEIDYMMDKPISFCPACGRKVKWDD